MRIARLAIQRLWSDPEADWFHVSGEIIVRSENEVEIELIGDVHIPTRKSRLSIFAGVLLKKNENFVWESVSVLTGLQNALIPETEKTGRFWCGEYPQGASQKNALLPIYKSWT